MGLKARPRSLIDMIFTTLRLAESAALRGNIATFVTVPVKAGTGSELVG